MKKRFRVGVFDSGIGGLGALHACVKSVSCAKFYYYGDNKRAPYGNRSEEEIRSFTREALNYFLKMGADVAVIACNTATAAAVGEMRREFPFPVIGMEPAVKLAAAHCKKVLVLATERTAESARMQVLLKRFPECDFTLAPCAHLAAAIEKYYTEGENFLLSAHLPEGSFDGVVLGCSHYSFFADKIAAHYSCPVFDGNEGVAKRLEHVLHTIDSGTADHFLCGKNTIKFVGKSRKINKSVYFRTYVLQKTEKK